jgi:RND superfamily putative drug exporter
MSVAAPEREVSTPAPAGRPRWGLAIVVALVVAFIGMAGMGGFQSKLASVEKNDNASYLPSSAESTKVDKESEKFADRSSIPGFIVYQRNSGLTSEDKAKIASDAGAFADLGGVAKDQIGKPIFSEDGSTASISVPLIAKENGKELDGQALTDNENDIIDLAKKDAPRGLSVYPAGAGGILSAFIESFAGIDGILLGAALLVVIVILLIVYRSPVLWFFPLFSAVLALGLATILVYFLTKSGAITLNGQSAGILNVLVLGAGTDYALLIVSRYREELHTHESRWDAMRTAWRGAAPPIAASAATVIVGLMCMLVSQLNSNRGLGPVLAIGVACTLFVMLTFLPAVLVMLPRGVFWPRVPHFDADADVASHGMWGRIAQTVGRRSRLGWIVTTIVLLVCVGGLTQLKDNGISNTDSFTNNPSAVQGQKIYSAKFDKGAGAPVVIAVNADKADEVIDKVSSIKGIAADPGSVCLQPDYAKVAAALSSGTGGAIGAGCLPSALSVEPKAGRTLINATLTSDYDSDDAYDTVKRVRAAVHAIAGANAKVGGQSALNYDVLQASARDRNVIIPLVLLVILVILALLLRSILAPLLLIATVVLSFAATVGVSALVFNHVFGFAGADPSFVLFAFVFLVALGIDYNIFLMTRIREETLEFGTRTGTVRGLSVTGGVITSAGVVLASTFAVLGVLPLVFLAELGFAVAFGVLLDTIVVRSILVPALSHDIGKAIWWPSKLAKTAD